MNKRKRDIFTVIESVPNWFTASDQPTRSIEADTRATDVTHDLGYPLTHTASGEKDASSPEDQIGPRLRPEYVLEPANWAEASTGPLSQPWVEEWVSPDTSTGYQAGSEVEGVTTAEVPPNRAGIDWGISRGSQEGIDGGIGLGSREGVEGGDDLWVSQRIEVAEGGHSVQEAFWKLLHNVGYDT